MLPICLVMLLADAPATAESGLPAGAQRWPADAPGSTGHGTEAPTGNIDPVPDPGHLRLEHPLALLPDTPISRTAPGDGANGRLPRREYVGVSSFTVGETPENRVDYRSGDVILYFRFPDTTASPDTGVDTVHPDRTAGPDGNGAGSESAGISVGFPPQDAGRGIELTLTDLPVAADRSFPGDRGYRRHDTGDTAYRRPRAGHRLPGAGLDAFDTCSADIGFRGPCAGAFVSF
jgi:hypothetical protein